MSFFNVYSSITTTREGTFLKYVWLVSFDAPCCEINSYAPVGQHWNAFNW